MDHVITTRGAHERTLFRPRFRPLFQLAVFLISVRSLLKFLQGAWQSLSVTLHVHSLGRVGELLPLIFLSREWH